MKYFVKLVGKAFGPLDEEKIIEMYHAGRLKDPVKISRDKEKWDLIDIILPPPPPPETPPDEPPKIEEIAPAPAAKEIEQKFTDPNAPVWNYSIDGSHGYGPVTKSDLGTLLQCGMIKTNSLVWRQGENSRPISAVPELIDILIASSFPASSRAGGMTGSVTSSSSLSNNPMFNSAFSSNSMKNSGLTDARSSSNTNMFDLIDDPNSGNNVFGRGGAFDRSPVGQTSRISYVLMAIFFGQLGIHNFYANRMEIAIVQLFIGLSNLVGLIIISFVSMATEGQGRSLFVIPAIIGFGLELWAIIETCSVTHDGTGKRMY